MADKGNFPFVPQHQHYIFHNFKLRFIMSFICIFHGKLATAPP